MKHLADMIHVVPHAQVLPDDLADTGGSPGEVRKAVRERTLPQEGADRLLMFQGQTSRTTSRGGGLQAALALETLFPGVVSSAGSN